MSGETLTAIAQIFGAIASLVASIVGALAWRAGRTAAAAAIAAREETTVIGKTVDGRMQELLEVTRENASMKGKQDEKDAQAGREADAVGNALKLEHGIAAGVRAAEVAREKG